MTKGYGWYDGEPDCSRVPGNSSDNYSYLLEENKPRSNDSSIKKSGAAEKNQLTKKNRSNNDSEFEIIALGVGSAFTTPPSGNLNNCDFQSNFIVRKNGKCLLIDCGSDIRFSLAQQELSVSDIDAVYISHQHADHIGGMEWLAFSTYFNPTLKKPTLYCVTPLMRLLWKECLKGGLSSLQGKVAHMTEYFDCVSVPAKEKFEWEGITCQTVQTVHIVSGYVFNYSFGLIMDNGGKKVFLTTDTQHAPNQITEFYNQADLILQDCETAPFKSGIHAHYSELAELPADIKSKMYLYHYQPDAHQEAKRNGFKGFLKKGDIIVVD